MDSCRAMAGSMVSGLATVFSALVFVSVARMFSLSAIFVWLHATITKRLRKKNAGLKLTRFEIRGSKFFKVSTLCDLYFYVMTLCTDVSINYRLQRQMFLFVQQSIFFMYFNWSYLWQRDNIS